MAEKFHQNNTRCEASGRSLLQGDPIAPKIFNDWNEDTCEDETIDERRARMIRIAAQLHGVIKRVAASDGKNPGWRKRVEMYDPETKDVYER